MQPYSKEFRLEVLAACDAGGGTREVATQFDVSESWVRRIKQERRESGKVAPKTTRDRKHAWESWTDWLKKKIDERPDIYLREIQADLKSELGVEVSLWTISKACRAVKRTRKKRR
jgi:transposase